MSFLKLKLENEQNSYNIFDDVEIIVDPDLDDESTVDINNYLNKFILQCRICGNLFPSDEILDNKSECPICNSKSSNGFIYKGKLLHKSNDEDDDQELSDNEINVIQNINNDNEHHQNNLDYNNDISNY